MYLQPEQKPFINVKALDVSFNDDIEYDDLWLDIKSAPDDSFMSENDPFYRRVRGVRPPAMHASMHC